MSDHVSIIDLAVLSAYILATLYVGLRHAGRQRNLEDYFLAERSVPWWAAGISIVASDISAVSYIGIPAYVYEKDLQFMLGQLLSLPLVLLIVIFLFVPFMARLRLYTIYQYLERRFGIMARTSASGLFLLLRGSHLAVAIYAQALALKMITGLDTRTAILLCGSVVTVYTVLGGMKAVIWTDVMQFFVTSGGIIAVLIAVAIAAHGDLAGLWQVCANSGHTRLATFEINPFAQITFWSLWIGCGLNALGSYSTDQVLVQRYLATKSKRDMTKAIVLNGVLGIPQLLGLFAVGIGLTAYYAMHPSLGATLSQADQVLPHFIVNVLPTSVAGLVIAGMLAATMSSVSAGINSLSTATMIDFVQRFRRRSVLAETDVRSAKLISILWGITVTLSAIYAMQFEGVAMMCVSVIGFFSGPLMAMFLLGILTVRVNQAGVLGGAFLGTLLAAYASTTSISGLLYGPIGCITGLASGYLMSYFFPKPDRATVLPLTIWAANQVDLPTFGQKPDMA